MPVRNESDQVTTAIFDTEYLTAEVLNWENVSSVHSVEGDIYRARGQPFMMIRQDRIFIRLDPEVQEVIKEWAGIWPVHNRLLGFKQWVQLVASKTIQTGIRGLLRLSYEYVMRPRGILL